MGAATAGAQSSVTLAWNAASGGGVTGYRVYSGTASRMYSTVANAGNTIQTTISGLTNGGTYYFAVTAYNAAGLESDFSTEVTYKAGAPSASNLVFSAGSGTITAPFSVTNGVVSQTVQTTLSGSGRAVYDFTIGHAGNYIVSAIVNAPNGSANSFFVNIDAEPTDPQNIWDIPITSGFTNRTVSWATGGAPQLFNLSEGDHQLIIRGREANAQISSITITPAYAELELTRLPNKQVLLSGMAVIGQMYDVEASSDLKNWTAIGTLVGDNSGSFALIDSNAGAFAQRYYRLHETSLQSPIATNSSVGSLTGGLNGSTLQHVP